MHVCLTEHAEAFRMCAHVPEPEISRAQLQIHLKLFCFCASFRELAGVVGESCMGWRYDPIIIDQDWTVERHTQCFESMAAELAGFTHTAVISFIDLYEKVKQNYSL